MVPSSATIPYKFDGVRLCGLGIHFLGLKGLGRGAEIAVVAVSDSVIFQRTCAHQGPSRTPQTLE